MHALPTPTPTSHIGGKVSHALIHLHQPHIGWKGSHGTVTLTHICYIGLEGSILSHIHHLYSVQCTVTVSLRLAHCLNHTMHISK